MEVSNKIVIVQGQPAVGKSTLIRNLKQDFPVLSHLPLIVKDGFKDAFFNQVPYGTSAEDIEIGRKYHAGFSFAAVEYTGGILADAGTEFRVDGNFGKGFNKSLADWRKNWNSKNDTELEIIQILLGCDPTILAQRLRDRLERADPKEISQANINLGVDTAIERIGDGWLPELEADKTYKFEHTYPQTVYSSIKDIFQTFVISPK